eukprot:NODE_15449_length_1049_cov_7.947939.p1 GENE.NODE_15449_length_1049_cov_7.947939~~NODE_15449_length_1049_cov_7.947939.p1  ORF type:complete len:172 (-),score=36.47 NODE_15449_length_1049_cov_7.947939:516-1031(-)
MSFGATAGQRRLLREFKKVTGNTLAITAAAPVGDDLFHWSAVIIGAPDTCWDGGVWRFDLRFPPDYPVSPPTARFVTEIFHPNVYPDGRICLSIFHSSAWSPQYDVHAILLAVQCLLTAPDTTPTAEGSANPHAEELYTRDTPAYYAHVKELTERWNQIEHREMDGVSAVP